MTEKRIEKRETDLLEKWQKEHPGEKLTPEKAAEIRAEAEKQVVEEVAKEREEALKKGGSALGNFLTGNWFMAVFDLVGLAGLGVTAYQKAKGV